MLGLPGFVVLSVDEIDGELEVAVATTAWRVGFPRVRCDRGVARPTRDAGA